MSLLKSFKQAATSDTTLTVLSSVTCILSGFVAASLLAEQRARLREEELTNYLLKDRERQIERLTSILENRNEPTEKL